MNVINFIRYKFSAAYKVLTVTHNFSTWRFSNLKILWPMCKVLHVKRQAISFQSNSSSQEEKNSSFETLKELCEANAEYYKDDNTENGQRLYLAFLGMNDNIDEIRPMVFKLQDVVTNYDFDADTPANGYRSFLSMVDKAVKLGTQLNEQVSLKRSSVLFRKANSTKEIEACAQLLASLGSCLKVLEIIRENCPPDELFPHEHLVDNNFNLIQYIDTVNQYCFYGRNLGFHFCDSMRAALKFISLSMAIFSEAYYSEGSLFSKATTSFMTSMKYLTDPEEKAKRLVNISQNADIDFCKAFWFLSETELMKHLPSIVAHKVSVSKVINIPTEPLSLEVDGKQINIPIPMSYIGQKPVQVRLISWKSKEGMIGQARCTADPPSRGLFFHCHGGGFVAQSSRSHEVYLRQWATELDVPILSVDYSLAPKTPFPRALEEILYVYCWAIKNSHLLGFTGERIVAGGDSAGANLVTSLSLKCLELGVPIPHGLFLAYAPFYVNTAPSPSRLLCLSDPLLPFGFLARCLKAYTYKTCKMKGTATSSDTESFEEFSESDLLELQAHKSPVSEASDTLTYASLTSQNEDVKDVAKTEELEALNVGCDASESQKYVCSFIEKYASDSLTEEAGKCEKSVPDLTSSSETSTTPINEPPNQTKVLDFFNNLKTRIENFVPSAGSSGAVRLLDNTKKNILEDLKYTVPRNPFISPYCASDNMLQKLPPVKLFSVQMDPCLDDCIMFAKKLKKLNHDVTIDVIDGLPHGFLNFSLVSKEAYDASKMCSQKIWELLDLKNLPPLK